MKKLLTALLSIISLALVAQESIKFENTAFKDILAKAKKENKIIFLDAYASWCGPCKMMEKNVFSRPAVQNFYNKTFINARFDMERGEGRDIASKYAVQSYPTLLFINGDGEVVKRAMGYHEEKQFIDIGRDADRPVYKGISMEEKFDRGEADPAFLKNLIEVNATTNQPLAQKAAERYFSNKKDQSISDEDIYLLLNFTKSSRSENYKILQKYRAEILKKIPESTLRQFETALKLNDLGQECIDSAKKEINEGKFLKEAAAFTSAEEARKYLTIFKLNFYPAVGNFEAFAKAAIDYYRNPDGVNPAELLSVAMVFAENVRDKASLTTASQWVEKSVMSGETPENTYTLAKLYFKTGNRQMAKDFAETSRKLAAAQGKNTEKIDALILEIGK